MRYWWSITSKAAKVGALGSVEQDCRLRFLAKANCPEVRRYRQIYVKNDEPVGLWSDVVSVTVQP